ncbi:MAG TPA: hypothetical protein VMU42_10680 [Candidatus Sulfotelmatobacter sp.]|nr:hypothetical protein [Candidatus Sulfotelmatobacter sp.]
MTVELIAEDTRESLGTLPVDVPEGSPSPARFAMHGYQYAPDGPLLANPKPHDPGQQRFHRTLRWLMVRTEDGTWQVHIPRQHVGWVKLLPKLRPPAK